MTSALDYDFGLRNPNSAKASKTTVHFRLAKVWYNYLFFIDIVLFFKENKKFEKS